MENNNHKETGLIILIFASLNLPETLMIGYERVNIRPYIPLPLRCRNCLRLDTPHPLANPPNYATTALLNNIPLKMNLALRTNFASTANMMSTSKTITALQTSHAQLS